MSSVNRVILIGRCGQNPEAKTFDNGNKVVNISLATSESWKDRNGEKKERTTWHNLVFFGKLADVVEQYVSKGNLIYIEGKIQVDEYEKDGVKRYATKINCNTMTMLGGKNESAQPSSDTSYDKPQVAGSQEDIDDLPF